MPASASALAVHKDGGAGAAGEVSGSPEALQRNIFAARNMSPPVLLCSPDVQKDCALCAPILRYALIDIRTL